MDADKMPAMPIFGMHYYYYHQPTCAGLEFFPNFIHAIMDTFAY